jgi:predicted Zn finger-like uncharacterized protein
MALQCPNCGATVTAANINIQETLAVCTECNHVFKFDGMVVKRKTKPPRLPDRLRIHEDNDDHLTMSYRLVFGPGARFGFFGSAVGTAITLIAIISAIGSWEGFNAPGLLVVGALCAYMLAVFVTTTTRITLDDETLDISSGPLPFPLKDSATINVDDIRRVYCREEPELFPMSMVLTHHLYAELYDGDRARLITALPRNYAHYIARTVDAHLQADRAADLLDPAIAALSEPDDSEWIDWDEATADQSAERPNPTS